MAGQNAHGAFVRLYLMGSNRVLERPRGTHRRPRIHWVIDGGADCARLLAPLQPREQSVVGHLFRGNRERTLGRIERL